MGSKLYMFLLSRVLLFHVVHTNSFSCHDEESSALLQFKQSFIINRSASYYDYAYPKVSSWKPTVKGENNSCCSWNGVECDEKTGHVIGLDLSSSCLHGSINSSSSLFHLVHLQRLNLADNNLNYSQIPNVVRNFPKLTHLNLSSSSFSGQIPSEVWHLSKLLILDLSRNHINGPISASLANLTQLTTLSVCVNQLTGPIPSSLGNLSTLTKIDLSWNELNGSIPESLSNLINLLTLYLNSNNFNGTIHFNMFHKLQNLAFLDLSSNKLDFLAETRTVNATISRLQFVGLGSCNIGEFPNFLQYQKTLLYLDLSANKIQGQVPKWMWNTSTESLVFMNISHNFLSGFDQPPVVLPWVNLRVLDLSSNMLHGPLPIPGPNISYYEISNNKLTGAVSPLLCNWKSLQYLDLSDNRLSGILPQCLVYFSDKLQILKLGNNSFHGILPQTGCTIESSLRMLDVSHNQLQGKLPRSLADCLMLEFIVLSSNEFNDVFPVWLGTLQGLKLLSMRNNGFHGLIENHQNNYDKFPSLLVLDLSQNNFTGKFPPEYIFSANSIRGFTPSQSTYMQAKTSIISEYFFATYYECYSTTITSKGVERYYPQIRENFGIIDISSNRFEGKIPEFIGDLKGLRFVNVSNNIFTGHIPSSMGNLTLLEALDLSNNKLSGEIPQQITLLTFLAKFNVTRNNLSGGVPHGSQFTTFDITSYEGNPGLCGDPLPKKCGNSNAPQLPPPTQEEIDSGSVIEFDWKFVLAGFGSGLVVGVVLADVLITWRNELFITVVGVLISQIRVMRRRKPIN